MMQRAYQLSPADFADMYTLALTLFYLHRLGEAQQMVDGFLEEAESIGGDAQLARQVAVAGGNHCRCQDDHVRHHLYGLTGKCVGAVNAKLPVVRHHPAHPPAHIRDLLLLHHAAHELFIAFARGPDVHVEDVGVTIGHLVLVEERVLGRVHAAHA